MSDTPLPSYIKLELNMYEKKFHQGINKYTLFVVLKNTYCIVKNSCISNLKACKLNRDTSVG